MRPHVLAWLVAVTDASPAEEEAAGNVALCIGNIAARVGLREGKGCLHQLRQAGAVRALIGEYSIDAGPASVQYLGCLIAKSALHDPLILWMLIALVAWTVGLSESSTFKIAWHAEE